MVFCLCSLIGILVLIIILLLLKNYLLKKAAREINEAFGERLITNTNTLIGISSRDKYMRQLAAGINNQLRVLRKQRHQFQEGDAELKNAITNITHDLRTPLTAICGYLDLLKLTDHPEEMEKYLKQIQNRTEAMNLLLEELFRYSVVSSVRELNMEPMDLRKSLEESLISFDGAMQQENIEPNINIPEHPIKRVLDISAVNRIFNNIISNALKYSDGDLEVRMDEQGTIIFSNSAKKMTPLLVERLFDRFYTVETGRNSTGLGLSIAKLLTENMGGQIIAEYKQGKLYITISFADSK